MNFLSFQNEPFLVLKNDSGVESGGYKGFIIDLMDEVTKDMADVDYQGRDSTTFSYKCNLLMLVILQSWARELDLGCVNTPKS